MKRNKTDILYGENFHYLSKAAPPALDSVLEQAIFKSARPNAPAGCSGSSEKTHHLVLIAQSLIEAYRRYGHFKANLDPLNLEAGRLHPSLNLKTYNLTDEDLHTALPGIKLGRKNTIQGIYEQLQKTYCSTIGYEYKHLTNIEEIEWWQRRIETAPFGLAPKDQKLLLEKLVAASTFEAFLDKKFPGAKRFGLEGLESFIPLLSNVLDRAAKNKLESAAISMAHRGRLNTLCNIMGKPFNELLALFLNKNEPTSLTGDVKYHLGYESTLKYEDEALDVYLMNNPSHLESVNPVAAGFTKALQVMHHDALAICVHGDASIIGQGVVAESLQMSQLDGYNIGGTMHIVLNNQIGFTANSHETRTGHYCTDVAKAINAPVIHVNNAAPEAVIQAAWLAYSYREKFHKDVFIDLIGYRKNGHNEGDDPRYTNPLMYSAIKKQGSIYEAYAEKIGEDAAPLVKKCNDHFQELFEKVGEAKDTTVSVPPIELPQMKAPLQKDLQEWAQKLHKVPEGFKLHSRLEKLFRTRLRNYIEEDIIDWAGAELLAYASLVSEGVPVRLSGQDARRGTFSHRHAYVFDQETDNHYCPLQHIGKSPLFEAYNSHLSEFAVMGFEYGCSLHNERQKLVIWEAQFGDFSNGAQPIIDLYLASGEAKWGQTSNLVLYLPHGYEGQGPEHSSARLERYLQLCAQENMRVVNLTNPANLFHLLRDQVNAPAKPLVVMTPKSLLRHPQATCRITDLSDKGFEPLVVKYGSEQKSPKKIIFCSGKVALDLVKYAETHKRNVHVVAIEQLFPFPLKECEKYIKKYPKAEVVWCQEEPQNQGAWWFVMQQFAQTKSMPSFIGREAAAATSTGYPLIHQKEFEHIIQTALDIKGDING